jgi:hypothetical protein
MFQTPESIILPLLDPGERLLWSGQPRGGIRFRRQDVYLVPFSLFWGGFAIFWEIGVLTATSKASNPLATIFPLFGVPFVIVGLYLIFGRFYVDARNRARTTYGITSERIIIVSGLFSPQVKSLQLRTLSDISLTESRDGSGTISFGPTTFVRGFPMSWNGSGNSAPSFEMIEGAKGAYGIIRSAQRTVPTDL